MWQLMSSKRNTRDERTPELSANLQIDKAIRKTNVVAFLMPKTRIHPHRRTLQWKEVGNAR